jgi:hypothetical protein
VEVNRKTVCPGVSVPHQLKLEKGGGRVIHVRFHVVGLKGFEVV